MNRSPSEFIVRCRNCSLILTLTSSRTASFTCNCHIVKENSADAMVNFKVFALFSLIFVTCLRLDNAVPFNGLRDEVIAGECNFHDIHVLCSAIMELFHGCSGTNKLIFTRISGILHFICFTFIGTVSAKTVNFWSRYKPFSQLSLS